MMTFNCKNDKRNLLILIGKEMTPNITSDCFCIYTAFNNQQNQFYQVVSFRASSTCIVETISMKDLFTLQRSHIELSDTFKQVEIDILNGEKTNLDYFRYIPPRNKEISDDFFNIIKSRTRSKFRQVVLQFCQDIKSGNRKPMLALDALKKFQIDREAQQAKINDLKFNTKQKKKSLLEHNCKEKVKFEDVGLEESKAKMDQFDSKIAAMESILQ